MSDVVIQQATEADVPTIQQLAYDVWWPTYGELLPHGQIDLMLDQFYSSDALQQQMTAGHQFWLAIREGLPVGFVGYRPKPSVRHVMRIERLYVLPSEHRRGTGTRLLNHVLRQAKVAGMRSLELNVYRNNPAKAFYERQGFQIAESIKIPYHGYVLDDYVMSKLI